MFTTYSVQCYLLVALRVIGSLHLFAWSAVENFTHVVRLQYCTGTGTYGTIARDQFIALSVIFLRIVRNNCQQVKHDTRQSLIALLVRLRRIPIISGQRHKHEPRHPANHGPALKQNAIINPFIFDDSPWGRQRRTVASCASRSRFLLLLFPFYSNGGTSAGERQPICHSRDGCD